MKRLTLATVGALLALPTSALAASGSGVVLSVDARHHSIELVDSSHVVHSFHYRGRLPRLHAGSRISFRRSGKSITRVSAGGKQSRTVSFVGRVVRSSKRGFVLRLADAHTVSFSSHQVQRLRRKSSQRHKRHARAAAAANITVNIQGLEPGVEVLITETVDEHGNVTITISLPSRADGFGGRQTVSGVVSELDNDAFMVQTEDGSDLRLHVAASRLDNIGLQVCDAVDVVYHQDAGMLIADRVQDNGGSSSADCSDPGLLDEVGTITEVSGDTITIDTEDQGSMTFSVDDPDITDGFQVGDVVDVSYADNGDGTFDASDVEYVEQDVSGTVTAVSDGSMTITDADTGQPETFTADPADAMFDGVSVGDEVDVNYHQSGSQQVVDSIDDQSGD
jgi:archaellum component FlaF (FlaF/FlaG flagellin family)